MSQRDEKSAGAEKRTSPMSATIVVLSLIVALAIGGIGGYFIARSHDEGTAPQVAAGQQRPTLPPGVKRLPPKAFGHWVLDCVVNAQNVKRCSLAMRVVDKDKRALLLAMLIGRSPKGKPVLLIVTPPGAMLPAGLHLTFGNRPETKVDFVSCARACRAVLPIDQAQQDALSEADTTQVSFVAANGKTVSYKLPTGQFSDAFAAWQGAMPAPAEQ